MPRFLAKCRYGFCLLLLLSCGGGGTDSYVPKPKSYPKIDLPSKQYNRVEKPDLPVVFEIPQYALLAADSNNGVHTPGWYNVNFPQFDATLFLTYYPFDEWDLFDSLLYDTRKLVNKHLQKADDILERPTQSMNPLAKGLIYDIQGNTASNVNFYVTDSVGHFLRGALYFNHHTESDSIAPVLKFIEQDVYHLIKTIRWK